MKPLTAVIIFLLVLVVIVVGLWGPIWFYRERKPGHSGDISGFLTSRGPQKERFGPPPGRRRSIHRDELGYRGWPDDYNQRLVSLSENGRTKDQWYVNPAPEWGCRDPKNGWSAVGQSSAGGSPGQARTASGALRGMTRA